jgi:hypothetical protein
LKRAHKYYFKNNFQIIAATGDSLTAACHGLDFKVLMDNRGIGWAMGGQDTWRKYLTLPNILKEYNPKLYGYSLENVEANKNQDLAKLNVAKTYSLSSDAVRQTKELINKMKNDKNVDIKNDWKFVTYLTGSNNFCKKKSQIFSSFC